MGFPSKVRHLIDAAANVTLRDISDGAETGASVYETAIDLEILDGAYWHNDEIPQQTFAAVIEVTALDVTDGDGTYVINLQVDSVVGFGDSPVIVASLTVPSVGVYVVNLDGPTIRALDANAAFLRVGVVTDETTPSITYGAWLAPAVQQG
jgi:hypothetical protein